MVERLLTFELNLKIMENTQTENRKDRSEENRRGRVMSGLLIIAVGTIFLLRQADFIFIPSWLFSWEIFMIVIGLYIGFRSNFRNWAWFFPIFIGTFFLLDGFLDDFSIITYLWPLAIIFAGLFVIFGSGRKKNRRRPAYGYEKRSYRHKPEYSPTSDIDTEEPYIESVSVFGSIKKNVITKDFRGGEIVTFFGGAEYNLSQADIHGDVVLEVVQIFGGARLIIPPHWEIKSELVAVLGGIEDKRPPHTEVMPDGGKRLILKGVSVFGGLDIRSY